MLALKLLLAPAFVVLITLAVRRFGPRVGGVLGGLPVVAGPILFIYALDHGTHFAATAATNSVAALTALATFLVVVVRLGPSYGAISSVVVGWLAFLAVAAMLVWLSPPAGIGLALSCLAFGCALRVIPAPDPRAVAQQPRRPPFDLLLRAAVAAAMVLALTSVARELGPATSGVLAPFPTITSVLAGFATAHETRATTLHLLRSMIRGFFSFAACLFTLAVTLEAWGTALAFLSAIAVTATVQLGLLAADRRPGSAWIAAE